MTINWSQDTETVIVTGLGLIPEVGGLLAGLVTILWPKDPSVDVWSEIRDEVQQEIKQQIAQNNYDRVTAQLGNATQRGGLIGDLQDYQGAVNGTNGQDVGRTWSTANGAFIDASSAFEQVNCEVLLLPLFAQMANLHLTLLSDGVQRGFCNTYALQSRIRIYTQWANKWMQQAISDSSTASKGFYNPANQVARFMQLTVGNFVQLWPYFDRTLYSQPVTIPTSSEIFYTASEATGLSGGNKYTPPGTRAGYISEIDIYSLWSASGNDNQVAGCNVSYSGTAGSSGFSGVNLKKGTVPTPLHKSVYLAGTYNMTSVTTNHANPIIRIDGRWRLDSGSGDVYIRYIQFTFKNNTYTMYIPSDIDSHGSSYGNSLGNFTIIPPSDYYLSSIWMSNIPTPHYGTGDVVFGWQKEDRQDQAPPSITCDPQNWVQRVPTPGSVNWVTGYSVQYTIAWIYADTTTSNIIGWSDPITNALYTMPTLILPTPTGSNVVGAKVWRWFAGSDTVPEYLGQTSTGRFVDDHM